MPRRPRQRNEQSGRRDACAKFAVHFDSPKHLASSPHPVLTGLSAIPAAYPCYLAPGSRGLSLNVPTSALTETDGTGQRSSLARMASADLVQTKGLGLALCSAR